MVADFSSRNMKKKTRLGKCPTQNNLYIHKKETVFITRQLWKLGSIIELSMRNGSAIWSNASYFYYRITCYTSTTFWLSSLKSMKENKMTKQIRFSFALFVLQFCAWIAQLVEHSSINHDFPSFLLVFIQLE